MRWVDFYAINQSGGYGGYKLKFLCGNLRQLGNPETKSKAVLKRFVAADGSVIQYTGYQENRMTIQLECDSTQANHIVSGVKNGAFVIAGVESYSYSSRGTMYYLDGEISVKRISNKYRMYQISIPVLFGASNLAVPMIGLCTSVCPGGFCFGSTHIALSDCRRQINGSYRLTRPIMFAPGTKTTTVCVETNVGGGTFAADVSILLSCNGIIAPLDVDKAKTTPGDTVTIPDGTVTCQIEIRSNAAVKPLIVQFTVRRYGE